MAELKFEMATPEQEQQMKKCRSEKKRDPNQKFKRVDISYAFDCFFHFARLDTEFYELD